MHEIVGVPKKDKFNYNVKKEKKCAILLEIMEIKTQTYSLLIRSAYFQHEGTEWKRDHYLQYYPMRYQNGSKL